MKKILLFLSVILLMSGLGCAALSHYITPAEIDRDAVSYAHLAGTARLEDYGGWPNMVKAERLKDDVDAGHSIIQLDLRQQIESDNLEYSIHADTVSTNLINAQQREEALFGPEGLLSMGLSLAGMGGFTGILGLMRKRPGDITPGEVQQVVADATGRTVAELEARNKHLTQVVKGIKIFMDAHKGEPDIILSLKKTLSDIQDSDTEIAVKAAKNA